jgi:DNA-binding NtrC family response regulator
MTSSNESSTFQSPAARLPSPLATGCVLVVTSGPDAGKRFPLDGRHPSRVLLGQSPACEIRLSDHTVSRRHAGFEMEEHGVRLVDLGSTNGTRVNDLRIADVLLAGGETIRVGDTVLVVESLQRVAVPTSDATSFGKTIGASPAMRRLYPVFTKLAEANVSILIEGETGTGKEVLAESFHDQSPRRDKPFIVFDCTTVVPTLVEATIFGHERGAFTGAVTSSPGIFEEADGGTLFLDEIGDLDLALQAKLLRALERSEVKRVGGTRTIRFDVRIIAATRRDLDREVQAGRFRDDLFFRLAVARVELPPLRKREGDIALLANTFWRSLGAKHGIAPDFLRRLSDYNWPGNVRQLRNVVMQQLALGEVPPFEAEPASSRDDQPETQAKAVGEDPIAEIVGRDLPYFAARDAVLIAFEQQYVARVLAQHGGHVGKAAEASGMGRRYFQRIRNRARDGEP